MNQSRQEYSDIPRVSYKRNSLGVPMCADFCFSQQKPLEKVAAQVQTWDVLEEAQGTSAQHRIPQTGDSRATGILEASLFVSGSNSLSCDGLESFLAQLAQACSMP